MLPNPTIEQPNLKSEQNPLSIDPSIADLEDFCSSLLDFDSIKDWCSPMDDDVTFSNPKLEKDGTFEQLGKLGTLIEGDIGNKGLGADVAELSPGLGKNGSVDLGALIEGDMGRVKLEELNEGLVADVADLKPKLEKADLVELGGYIDGTKIGKVESDSSCSDSESESESESESSDSSSSSDDDDEEEEEEEKVKEKVEVEDGEINDSDVEKMVGWSEDEFGDEDGGVSKGPIKSRNELKDLPHVPPVEVSLQPHHHTVPVGVISSIIDAQVIVEGVEQHNPLNEGTIFWVTESRTALGIVDEIFGPVKSPFYIIRYNSEEEVPEGIKQGTPISFVPEFANHVLKDNLYKKGYDASGENDEEVSDDYEFSDDEQEAEYRKLQKMKKKRGTNEANYTNEFNKKNFKNRGGGSSHQNQFSRNNVRPVQNNVISKNSGDSFHNNAPQGGSTQVTTNQNQQNGNDPNPFTAGQNYGNPPSFIPPFQQMVQSPGFILPPNVMWMNGMPGQPGMMNGMPGQPGMMNGMPGQPGMMNGMPGQPGMMNGMPGMMNGMPGQQGMMNGMPGQQGIVFPNGMMWPQQNLLPNGVPFPQQFAQNQNFTPNSVLPGTQPNFSEAPSFGLQPGPFAQNGPNQQLGLAMPMNMNGQQCPSNPGSMEMPREFDQGGHRGGGRGPHHRGGGRSRGGRGRHQAK